ncbi:GL15125 [Drosophila persimilis]|uniref:GL15125 n=1 Tax=Drosophila persimilis TaxID=7234 RepID=B4H3X8_DROPE|nr:GL15125 [Drosophila persimilis]
MLPLRLPLPCKTLNAAAAVRMGVGALESDSLNETNFSPARFYKPNSRRKRKIKRMSMEFEFSKDTHPAASPHSFTESPLQPGMLAGPISDLALASTGTACRATPTWEEYQRMRPRSYSSTLQAAQRPPCCPSTKDCFRR